MQSAVQRSRKTIQGRDRAKLRYERTIEARLDVLREKIKQYKDVAKEMDRKASIEWNTYVSYYNAVKNVQTQIETARERLAHLRSSHGATWKQKAEKLSDELDFLDQTVDIK